MTALVATYKPTLGLVASHRRAIKPGREYDRFFRKPSGTNQLMERNASVFRTLELIEKKVKATQIQTKAITEHFVSLSTSNENFCKRVFDFLYNHIQYVEDEKGKEVLRSPNRLWYDRAADCDCFALTISTILTNAGLKHNLRIVEIDNKGYYQHIYVVVPKNQSKPLTSDSPRADYWVIDPVLDKFDKEPGE